MKNTYIQTNTTNFGLTLTEAKDHLNILDTSFDNLITEYITAAHDFLYQEASLLVDGVLVGSLERFENFYMDFGVVESVAVYYYNSSNVRTLYDSSNYTLVLAKIPYIEFTEPEPTVYNRKYPIEVEVTTSATVRPMVKQCLRMIVSDFFENRQSNVVGASVNRAVKRTTEYQIMSISYRNTL